MRYIGIASIDDLVKVASSGDLMVGPQVIEMKQDYDDPSHYMSSVDQMQKTFGFAVDKLMKIRRYMEEDPDYLKNNPNARVLLERYEKILSELGA